MPTTGAIWRPRSRLPRKLGLTTRLSLDIFWLRDESLDDSATLPHPSILAAEIVEDLRAALAQFQEIADDLDTDEAAV